MTDTTKKYKEKDVVNIYNTTLGGKLTFEGRAKLIRLDFEDLWEVEFENEPGETYVRDITIGH